VAEENKEAGNAAAGNVLSAENQDKLEALQKLGQAAGEESEVNSVEDDRIAKVFSVTNPVKIGGTIKYAVKGEDSQGEFEVVRRFNEFFALYTSLVERWPGCYIPCIPEKKAINVDTSASNQADWTVGSTKDGAFVEMRRALFERFIREMAKFPYLIESKEF